MKIITFSFLVLVIVASIALAQPTPFQSSAPSSIETEPVPAAVETPQGLVDKRNYRVQTTTAEDPEATYPAGLWLKNKRKRYHKDITEIEPANSIDTTSVWNVVERRADENGPSSTHRYTAKPPKTMTTSKPKPKTKVRTRTKQPPIEPTRAPKGSPQPNLPPPVPTLSSAPSPTPSSVPAPGPGSAEPNPPSEPPTESAMISNNAPKPDECRSTTLTWKIFIDKSGGDGLLRWRHEISYTIDRGSSDTLIFVGGLMVQDEITKKISEDTKQTMYFSPDGGFGVMITPVGYGTGIVWFWRSLTREYAKPSEIVPYAGDDMKYGYNYWDCIPASW